MNRYPVFVVGSTRSGKSLLVNILLDVGYHGVRDGKFFSLITTLQASIDRHFTTFNVNGDKTLVGNIDKARLSTDISHVFKSIVDCHITEVPWLVKSFDTGMIVAIDTIRSLWPESLFIFAKRRAIEAIILQLKNFPNSDFECLCKEWTQTMSVWRDVRDTLSPDKSIEIDQQDFLRDPMRVISSLTALLGLPPEHSASMLQTLQRCWLRDTDSAPDLYSLEELDWSERRKTTFLSNCLAEMRAYGYTLDESYDNYRHTVLSDGDPAHNTSPLACHKQDGLLPRPRGKGFAMPELPLNPSSRADTNTFVASLFEHLLHRQPRPDEVASWAAQLQQGMSDREMFRRFVQSPEFKTRNTVKPGHPPGHFYSPIVNPAEVLNYWTHSTAQDVGDLLGIKVDLGQMEQLWRTQQDFIRSIKFSVEAGGGSRYYHSDGRYPSGDAIVLSMMMNVFRPASIIEIGSGFSSAVMLDTADAIGLDPFNLTCIDPYADRLRSLMRPSDTKRVTILERKVQDVSPESFAALATGDFLFIDSSHVLKTGSDVHCELFNILPRLPAGAIVHFHDIHFPFEYPKEWVFHKAWSWNEIYAVRAFLTFNDRFKIIFFNDLFFSKYRDVVAESLPELDRIIGGSLWLQVQ